ncbi:outer membrane lipoprotein involved in outer membrane biogenesis [Polaromonas sp. CF318]|uniref:outer membrane lipoprotein LolB n=1 Tax=Polaromonas sp. CF318 TaxID=1144318 RepID=UPI0002710FAB|nr:outer membrane lipoprotein LolB [Polaromonas sp. CF318]EJL90467.1 outer membrane lipoprotein involved in outer membrane biogenesis [Polaromonas sp. CF318]
MPLTLSTRLARLALVFAGFFTALFLAGCAQTPRATAQDGLKNEFWTGRISLQVQSEPVQSFSASFELRGGPERGELSLVSPLGNVLGVLRWASGEALLDSGNGKVQRFASVDELMAQATGAAVPLGALFAWLRGDNAAASGWSADLSRYQDGRISAKRSQPAPQADLRVVLDQ